MVLFPVAGHTYSIFLVAKHLLTKICFLLNALHQENLSVSLRIFFTRMKQKICCLNASVSKCTKCLCIQTHWHLNKMSIRINSKDQDYYIKAIRLLKRLQSFNGNDTCTFGEDLSRRYSWDETYLICRRAMFSSNRNLAMMRALVLHGLNCLLPDCHKI